MMTDAATDLLSFIDASPTPYHAVEQAARRLREAGWQEIQESDLWELNAYDRYYTIRGGGSLVAFEIGSSPSSDLARLGVRIIGAHTDSPNFRIKPRPDATNFGYRQIEVEPYGGLLLHTWLDRDLSLAGRVIVANDQGAAATRSLLIDFARPLLRIPSLAIHLYEELRVEGLKLNAENHTVPVIGLEDAPTLAALVLEQLKLDGRNNLNAKDILGLDLMTYDLQPSSISGANREFINAPRLDNLASCHAAISALIGSSGQGASEKEKGSPTRLVVLYDHEEVGSRSASGAAGTVLVDVCSRIAAATGAGPQALERGLSRSTLVSADMAHAVHPNYADRHSKHHRPVIGAGPVIKTNANQSYATSAPSSAVFTACCRQVGVEPQHFVARSDKGCGSTIGPAMAARLGVDTVDVGNPMLSMHSAREMAGSADVAPMIKVLTAYLLG